MQKAAVKRLGAQGQRAKKCDQAGTIVNDDLDGHGPDAAADGKNAQSFGEAPEGDVVEQMAGVSEKGIPVRGPSEALGQIAWLMMQSPLHKHLFLADLEWLVAPAVILKQFRIFRKDGVPVAYASWAFLDDEAEARISAGEKRLRPADWTSGDNLWLIDLVAPFGGGEAILKELREKVFGDQSIKTVQVNQD